MIFERFVKILVNREKAEGKTSSFDEKSPVEMRQELLKDYKLWKSLADRYTNLGPSFREEMDAALVKLHSVENRIIETTENTFEKEFLQLYKEHHFNLSEIVVAEIEGNWKTPVKEAMQYLAEHMPAVAAIEGSKLLLWIFERVNQEKQSGKNIGTICFELKNHCSVNQTFCEIPIEDLGLTGEDLIHIFDFDIFALLIGSQKSNVFYFFCDLILKVEGGFEWLKTLLKEDSASND